MAERSGFFNALKTASGQYDRKYNANDYSEIWAAVVSNGVRRSGEDDLRVSASGGLTLKINTGYGWINGRWYRNDSDYTAFSVPTPPVGDRSRIDRIVLRLDTSIDARHIRLYYLQGEPDASPAAPALTRSGSVYELAIADISVPAGATSITALNITDQRGNGRMRDVYVGEDDEGHDLYKVVPGEDLCGWITTPVGYEGYFQTLDEEFEGWFGEVRDRLATATTTREYQQRITTEAQTSAVTFSIPQFDPTGLDRVHVCVNGLQAVEGIDYTRENSTITFTTPKVAGTDIDVTVLKSVDATGVGSVMDAVEELQEQMATIKNIGDYIYICNGYDDNVVLSTLAQDFFQDGPENGQFTVNVYGTFGANAPFSGTGAATSRYRWMVLGSASATSTKRVVVDFLNCSVINLTGTGENHYICFYGSNCAIKNANVVARQRGSTTAGSVVVFEDAGAGFMAESCRFDVSAYYGASIAKQGTFRDCYGTVTNSRDNSYCFALEAGLLRVFGGSYTAYTGLTSTKSAVFGEKGAAGALATYGVNCPTVAKAGHYQTNAAYFANTTTKGVLTGTITTLSVATAIGGGVTVRDTIAASFPSVLY